MHFNLVSVLTAVLLKYLYCAQTGQRNFVTFGPYVPLNCQIQHVIDNALNMVELKRACQVDFSLS